MQKSTGINSKSRVLCGHDAAGSVYDYKNFVLRTINQTHAEKTKKIYKIFQEHNLANLGIVPAVMQNDQAIKHPKYSISYPHEWTVSMFKDALLLHLKLFIELDQYGLTLKDAIPQNILFNGSSPQFIDFFSLVFTADLSEEKWLKQLRTNEKDYRWIIFNKMLLPYFVLPFFMFSKKAYPKARELLISKACNLGDREMYWKDVYAIQGDCSKIKNIYEASKHYFFIKSLRKLSFVQACKNLFEYIKDIPVGVGQSDYTSYYELKKESYSFEDQGLWKEKQKSVYKVISQCQPKTVLDLGANTGWFSILAELCGAHVIALDIDEACVDVLYQRAKQENLNIVSLVAPFNQLSNEYFAKNQKSTMPLLLSGVSRFNADLVLSLGLFHHLVLGLGYKLNSVFEIFSKLADKVLILEFIDLDDPLIKNEPSFFPHIANYNHLTYNIEAIINEGLTFFSSSTVLDSHPTTRKLIVFER